MVVSLQKGLGPSLRACCLGVVEEEEDKIFSSWALIGGGLLLFFVSC